MTRKKVGDPFPDGKGYVDEGGGRESGDEAVTQAGRPKLSTADVERTSSAAANPAACTNGHVYVNASRYCANCGSPRGGGRESGPGAEQREDERRTSLSSAAANPAACPLRIQGEGEAAHDARIRQLEARIAELEAARLALKARLDIERGARDDFRHAWESEKARIAEMEARLLAVSRAYASADWHLRQVADFLYAKEAGA